MLHNEQKTVSKSESSTLVCKYVRYFCLFLQQELKHLSETQTPLHKLGAGERDQPTHG